MMNTGKKALIATLLYGCTVGTATSDTTLGTITVTGQRYGGGYSGWSGGGLYTGGAGEPFSGYFAIVAFIDRIPLMKDVRCTGGALRDITSHASPENRKLAAESVYRALHFANLNMRSFWRNTNPAIQNNILEVTFADGGKEKYVVENPAFSVALSAAIPGSLEQSDGVVKPRPGCN